MKAIIKNLKNQITYLQETKSELQECGIKTSRVSSLLNSKKKELAKTLKFSTIHPSPETLESIP